MYDYSTFSGFTDKLYWTQKARKPNPLLESSDKFSDKKSHACEQTLLYIRLDAIFQCAAAVAEEAYREGGGGKKYVRGGVEKKMLTFHSNCGEYAALIFFKPEIC